MKESIALDIVQKYLTDHGYLYKRLKPEQFPVGTKVPDFEVLIDGRKQFYCELKSPELHPHPVTNMFHWSTTMSKLRDFMHTAVKQFVSVDPHHMIPWVLLFTSDHMLLNWTNMKDAINGKTQRGDTLLNDFSTSRFVTNTQSDMQNIDLIIWCQINSEDKRIYQYVPFFNHDSEFINSARSIDDRLKPRFEENIMDWRPKRFT